MNNLPLDYKFEIVILENFYSNELLRYNPYDAKENNCYYDK